MHGMWFKLGNWYGAMLCASNHQKVQQETLGVRASVWAMGSVDAVSWSFGLC
jgi:hypothetical protein